MKFPKSLLYTLQIFFSGMTLCLIVYALLHRDDLELIYFILVAYALVSVLISFGFVLYYTRVKRKNKEATQKRMRHLTQNLESPAMLWSDDFKVLVINEVLSKISGLQMRDDFDPRYVLPTFFGKKDMTDEDIREVVLAKNQEYSFTSQNGEPHDMIWNTSAIRTDDNGVTWFLSIGMDLADIRLLQSEVEAYSKRLTISEGKHNLTMELMDVGILLIEHGNPNLFPSDKLQKMLGITGSTITLADLREKVYPLDVVTFDTYAQNISNNMRNYIGKTECLELRLCAADGQYRWYSYRFKATVNANTGRMVIGGSVIDVTADKEKDAQIERIAYEDSVTKIPNRARLMEMGNDLFQCTVAAGTSYWVIVMDIDRFHLINDTCGYAAGNELLRQFAEVMNRQLSTGGFVARISGDNFAMMIRDVGDENLPEKLVGRIQRLLATRAVDAYANRALSCSAGYARMPSDGDNFERVLEHAEFALSSAGGKLGTINRYTHAMHDSIIQEANLELQLSEAVMRNQLVLYYQPKMSLETGEVVGVEGLVRWQHPSGQLLSPGLFIPIAEKSQLITKITKFVLYEACRQAHLWQVMGLPEIVMSINFTSTDFYQENVCEQIQKALQKYELDPKYLEIELTESLALMDIDLTISQMNDLRATGIQLAMDDFGTGYSSLSYFQRLPFTMLKLDRSFVMHMEDDPVVQEIVFAVVKIAKAKGIKTIAEGVELPGQSELLKKAGCDYVQGYLYGHPMTAKEAEAFIRANSKKPMK